MTEGKGYRKLKVWQEAHRFVLLVYSRTSDFSQQEMYGLTSQLRRAALSVPTNIVEGHAGRSKKEFLNFLSISNRSLVECEYLIQVASELGYITEMVHREIDDARMSVGIMLNRFMRGLREDVR